MPNTGNKLGTEHPRIGADRAYKAPRKSLKGKDGLFLYLAVEPRVAGSNPVAHPKAPLASCTCIYWIATR